MRAHQLLIDIQGLLIMNFALCTLAKFFEESADVVMAVSHNSAIVSFDLQNDVIGLQKASKTLLQLILFVIIHRDHEIRVAGLETIGLVQLLCILYVLAVN